MSGLRLPGTTRGPRRLIGWALLFVGAFVLAGAATALAFWTVGVNNGSGSYAAAQADSLSVPTTPAAAQNGSGAITVGWTLPGSQLPGAQYQVTRTSPGSPTTVCTVASTATSCQDTGLTPNTLYGYSVTAILDTWQSSAITASATTATPNFVITLSSGPYTAGTAATVQTVKAMIGSSVDTTYSGAKTITWSGLPNSPSNHAPSYPSSAVTFTSGVASPSSAVTVYAAGSNTLTATDASATAVTGSTSFTVAPAGAHSMVFTTQTTGAAVSANTVFPVQPVVTVEDLYGNTAVSYATQVQLTISGQTLGCTSTSVTPTAGVAAFAGCHGSAFATGVTLTAASTGLPNVTSASFSITKAANKLIVTTQPSTPTTAGSAFATQPVVSVEDTNGRLVTADSTTQVQLTAGGGTGTLTCTTQPLTVTLGVAAFTNCSINKSGTYTLGAAATGLTGATSSSLTITAGTATQLVFTTEPGGGANGATWSNQPVVTVEDSLGNTVTTSSAPVTLSINSQPGVGATLSCTTNPLTSTSGVASFAGCKIAGMAGTTYTLTAAAPGLTSATSNALPITVGPATQLVYTTQPGGGANGATWSTQPVVTVEDSGGNTVTTSSASVTLSINSQPGVGATLSCTTNPLTSASGVASFAGCKITGKTGSYTLTAAATGLTSATSNALPITVGPATQLVYTTQPGGGANGATLSTQPVVTVEDSGGNIVTTPSVSVALSINTQPGTGATLSCTTNPLTSASGVAAFAGCDITGKAGTYTLTAADTGLTSANSNNLTITVGPATQLGFTTQPGGGATGTTWSTQPVAAIEDSGGNTVTTSSASVTLSINTQPGTGATLSCTANPKSTTSGSVAFAGCRITGKAGAYTLTAAATGFASATSNALTISAGPATQLVLTTQPGGGPNGVALSTQPVLTVEDSLGNTVTTSSASVTLSISSQPGSGATLSCTTNPLTATSGVASFAGCKITGKTGSYTLTAAATGLTSATSSALTITVGPATQLVFSTQPGGGANGATWSTQPVLTVEDSGGNTVTTSSASVTLSINTQPGSGATLSCTTNPLTATSGVASFAGCSITGKAGTYTLTAAATGLTSATSNSLTITVGPPTQIGFTTQPGGGPNAATWSTQPVVAIEDSGGNTVTTSSASVTLSINTQPGTGATLSCSADPVTTASGVAAFTGCNIIGKAGTYTLTAAATGYANVSSNALTMTFGAATQLLFSTQPGGGGSGATWTTQPVVTVEDSGGNIVTTSSASVTLSINTQPGFGFLFCTTNPQTPTGGVVAFSGCTILGTTGTYTLNAAATGLTTATSVPFSA